MKDIKFSYLSTRSLRIIIEANTIFLKVGLMRHLSLVESDFEELEKKTLPRFPFCYLTFKHQSGDQVFEVKDISFSGMQLGLKSGGHDFNKDDQIAGNLQWVDRNISIAGNVKWTTDNRLGVEFSSSNQTRSEMSSFLEVSSITKLLKPLHKIDHDIDTPSNLKTWLRADGPFEVFTWQHNDGEFARFQILMMENFVEWEDGKGLKTARVISKRDIDTPLMTEDEIVFKIDAGLDSDKIDMAKNLLKGLSSDQLSESIKEFILIKLG